MAGDWIKIRAALLQSPKLIAFANCLIEERPFREWLTPGGSSPMNGQIVSDAALRCVALALVTRVWSYAREFGKFSGRDLFIRLITTDDLDGMADAPCVGEAMESVGWAVEIEGENPGVILPNFLEHNVPMTSAMRQQRYRSRATSSATNGDDAPDDGVTRDDQTVAPTALPREEKSIEDSPDGDSSRSEPTKASLGADGDQSPPVLIFPTVGKPQDPKEWGLTQEKLTEYQDAYPGIDVGFECRKALQWCRDNPAQRKTARGMTRFLNAWLERAQNRAGGAKAASNRDRGSCATLGGQKETTLEKLERIKREREERERCEGTGTPPGPPDTQRSSDSPGTTS